ncbi:hypothetical protein [Sphingorhabdus sp.]|uniref:hypothetical protein n=1 Tax=Sphingorhabdus sp. TaxID=1902408 RepID=UPI003341F2B3
MFEKLATNDWQSVPGRIAELLPYVITVKVAHEIAADKAGLLSTAVATWEPTINLVAVYLPEEPTKYALDMYQEHMFDGNRSVSFTYDPQAQPNLDDEIVIKRGALSSWTAGAWDTANKLLGGPTPLSNGIVSGLAAGGLGYGAGALAEQLFPERYIQRGKLRKTMGAAGLLFGAGLGANNAYANSRAMKTNFFQGLLTPNTTPVKYNSDIKTAFDFRPAPNPMVPGDSGLYSPTVSVPQFNSAAWNDVQRGMAYGYQNHTPPQFAAFTTGLMTGISTNNQSPIIRPIDVIHGIASAGVGLATANIAGRALSALAGLTPAGQNKLQDMGLWGGMMHAIVPQLFGSR